MVTMQLLPDLAATVICVTMLSLVVFLYQRWRTQNYWTLCLAFGGAAVSFMIIFLIEVLTKNASVQPARAFITLFVIGCLFTAFRHFFKPFHNIMEFLVPVVYVIIIAVTAITSSVSFIPSVAISFLASIGFCFFIWFKWIPHLPKTLLFQTAIIFLTAYIIVIHISLLISLDILSFIGSFFAMANLFTLLIIMHSRVVDMVESITLSAVTDGMTGLYNKAYFLRKLDQYIQSGQASAIVFSDIDNFKRLNDTQGHHIGDEILKLTSRIMKEVFDSAGIVGRYGGEEMVAVITNPKADALVLAEFFRSRIEEETDTIYPITVSVGVSYFADGISPSSLIENADTAMYEAKKQGKNRVVVG